MNDRRLQPTTVDYLLVGLSPALIIGMVNCLVFFLIVVVYRGDFTIRLMYLLGLYTFGSVLVARIAIEQSRSVAFGYAIGLGAAALFVVMRFVSFSGPLQPFAFPIVLGFLCLIAVLSDRITFDCTLIDEQEDSSGEGLLQSLGLVQSTMTKEDRAADLKKRSTSKSSRHNPGVWVLYFALMAVPLFGLGQLVIPGHEIRLRSLAFWFLVGYLFFALSLLVNTSILSLRRYLRKRSVSMPTSMAMVWMIGGIAGVLALLLIMSLFPLPGRNAGLVSLPFQVTSPDHLRPSRFGWGREGVKTKQPDKNAAKTENGQSSEQKSQNTKPGPQGEAESKSGPKSKSTGGESKGDRSPQSQQEKKAADQSDPKESPQSNPNQSNPNQSKPNQAETKSTENRDSESNPQPSEPSNSKPEEDARADREPLDDQDPSKESSGKENQDPSGREAPKDRAQPSQPNESESGDQEAENSESKEQPEGSSMGRSSSTPPSANQPSAPWQPPNWLGAIPSLFKWLTIIGLIAIILAYLARHGGELVAWWQSLFLKRQSAPGAGEELIAASRDKPSKRSFSSYDNPFDQTKRSWTPREVVVQTFEATEAWGRERGMSRSDEETPEEYLARLAQRFPDARGELDRLSKAYNRLAYAAAMLQTREIQSLASLWRWMQNAAQGPPIMSTH